MVSSKKLYSDEVGILRRAHFIRLLRIPGVSNLLDTSGARSLGVHERQGTIIAPICSGHLIIRDGYVSGDRVPTVVTYVIRPFPLHISEVVTPKRYDD